MIIMTLRCTCGYPIRLTEEQQKPGAEIVCPMASCGTVHTFPTQDEWDAMEKRLLD